MLDETRAITKGDEYPSTRSYSQEIDFGLGNDFHTKLLRDTDL